MPWGSRIVSRARSRPSGSVSAPGNRWYRCKSRMTAPGLPAGAREGLFARRVPPTAPPRHGYGLVIARELAERNGGTLTLAAGAKGTTFVLKLPVLLSVLAHD